MILLGIISDQRALASKSPVMHNAVLQKSGIEGRYVPLVVESDHLPSAVEGLRALGFAGANVTVPYKEAAALLMDRLAPKAKKLGAVNTIAVRDGLLWGFNTDVEGFSRALASTGFDPAGKEAAVFGYGGAAKAVLGALSEAGAGSVTVIGRNRAAAEKVAQDFGANCLPIEAVQKGGLSSNLIVNATSVSSPKEAPETADLVARLACPRAELIFDVNYGRRDNFWQDAADRLGAVFLDGLSMLAFQAAASFYLWTGRQVKSAWFRRALGDAS